MRRSPFARATAGIPFAATVLSCFVGSALAQSAHEGMEMDTPFMKDTMASMGSMHKDMMDTSKMNGVPDHDFLVMMIPHHQGAVGMAQAYLKYAKDPKARKLANGIIAAQKKEIAQMERWLKEGVGAKK